MRICSHCRRCYDDQVDFCSESDHPSLSETRSGDCEAVMGYRIERLLESGLTGDVYRARQIECDQPCHIRIVSPKKRTGNQFLREAKHFAELFHPNLVDVYETGVLHSGEFYTVSEAPDGQTLRDFLNAGGIPPLMSSVELMEQTAEALHVLHQEGLLHRALRPENVILTKDLEGRSLVRIKDVDFGGIVERSIIGNKFLIDTALDAIRYFAPEQFNGGRTSVQSDIYALGVILYEMLSGKPPFDAPKASGLIEKHRHQHPKELRIDNFDLRMLLTHTLNESLQKEPARRHSSALAFARQLRHMEQLATHVSTPPPAIAVTPDLDVSSFIVKAAAVGVAKSGVIEPEPVLEPLSKPENQPVSQHSNVTILDRFPAQVETKQVESAAEENVPAPIADMIEDETFIPEPAPEHDDPWMEPATFGSFESVAEQENVSPPLVAESIAVPAAADEHQTEPNALSSKVDRRSRLARMRVRKSKSRQVVAPIVLEEIPAIPETQPEIPTSAEKHIEPTLTELPEPELPIPNFIETDADEITAVTARAKPAVIQWQQPDDDIPSVEDVLESLSADNIEPKFDVEASLPPQPPPSKPRRKQPARDNDDIQFLQSVMRKSDGSGALDLYPSYSILSGYGAAQTRFSFDYQTLMVGAGLIAMVLLFLVGNLMFKQYMGGQAPVSTPSIGSVLRPSSQTQPQIAQTNTAKKAPKAFQKSKADEPINGDGSPFGTTSESKQLPAPKAQSQDPSPNSAMQARNANKPPSISSTLVISTENGKVRSTVETAARPADKRSPVATNKVTGTTRPRIVRSTN